MPADWFKDLMGFRELRYEETRANLEVAGCTLRSKVNKRAYAIGTLETPTLAELRNRAASAGLSSTSARKAACCCRFLSPHVARRARSPLVPRRSIETTSRPLRAMWVRRRTGRSTA